MPIHDYYFQRDQLFALPPFLLELNAGEQISAVAGRGCILFVGTSHGNISCWDLSNIHCMMASSTAADVKKEPVVRVFALQLPGKVSQLSVSLEGPLLAICDGFLFCVNTETAEIVGRSANGDGVIVCSSHTSLQLSDEQQPQRLDTVFFACRSGLSILSLPALAALRFVPNLRLFSMCECCGGVAATTESTIVHVSPNGFVQKLCKLALSQGTVSVLPGSPISFIPDSDEIVFSANDGGLWCCNVDVLSAPRQYQQPHFVFSPVKSLLSQSVTVESPSLSVSRRASITPSSASSTIQKSAGILSKENTASLIYSASEVCGQFCALLSSNGLVFTDLLRCSTLKNVSLPSDCMCMCMLDIGFIVASPDQLVAVLGDQHPAQEARSSMFTEAKLSLRHVKVNIECTLPNNQKINLLLALDMTIAQMIEVFFKSAGLSESEEFVLKFRCSDYTGDNITWNTSIALYEAPMVQFCMQPRNQRKLAFSAVRRTTTLQKEIALSKRKAEYRLLNLVGKHVLRTPEVIFFESKSEELWLRILNERRKEQFVEQLQRHYPQTPLLMNLPSFVEEAIDIKVTINMFGLSFKVFRMSPHDKPSVLLKKIFKVMGKGDDNSDDIRHYILKLSGSHEFLLSDVPLVCIRCVALKDPNKPISFTLVKVSQSIGHDVDEVLAAMSISAAPEEQTGIPSDQTETTACQDSDIVRIDIFDVENRLRVRVCCMERLDKLADEQNMRNESNLKELEKQKKGHGRKLDVLRENELLRFLLKENDALLWVRLELFSGDTLLCPAVHSKPVYVTAEQADCVRFDEWKELDLQTCFVPLGARLCISLMYCPASKFQTIDGSGVRCVGWVNQHIFDNNDVVTPGIVQLRLWQNNDITPINPMSMPYDNPGGNAGQIFLEFPRRVHDVVFGASQQTKSKISGNSEINPRLLFVQCASDIQSDATESFEFSSLRLRPPLDLSGIVTWSSSSADGFDVAGLSPAHLERVRTFFKSMRYDAGTLSADTLERVKQLVRKDAMYPLTSSDLTSIWKARLHLKNVEEALPKVILAIPCNDLDAQMSLQYLLQIWAPVGLVSALGLLDARFPSHIVREYAVKHLDSIGDSEIAEVLLQLVQALKFEPFHWSALAEFLLRRALASPFVIGQRLFWLLRSDMHVQGVSDRYGLLLTQYLWRCSGHAEQLDQEFTVVQSLLDVSNRLKDYPKERRFSGLQEMLSALKFPPSFTLPLSSTVRCSGLRIEKCGYMDSAKLPLKLVFRNDDPGGADVCVFAKSGDDLRQDLLCLQMLKIMDSLWRKSSLNLELSVYGCITTGQDCGFIEKVHAAHTISHIETAAGGASKAFAEDVLYTWLRSFHPTDVEFEAAREKFWRSTAGYCVMSWILGLGDRHNDNLMLTEQGRFLHIDFGHFLGNVKYFLGMNRDKAPFFFTKAMAFVIAGTTKDLFKSNGDVHERAPEVFKTFVSHCLDAFIIVRNHHQLFINLFRMMLSCGMPELEHAADIDPLRDAFFIDKTEAEARDEFRKLIQISMDTQMTQFNNFVHNVVHAKRL